MAEYKIERNDEDMRQLVGVLMDAAEDAGGFTTATRSLFQELAGELGKQIPIPAPLGVGAVGRTEHPFIGGLFLRWAPDNATHSPWIAVGNHETPYRTDEIGRITEVLTPGLVI
jgi:hypothetical protein